MNGYRRLNKVDRIRIKDFLTLGLSQTQIGQVYIRVAREAVFVRWDLLIMC